MLGLFWWLYVAFITFSFNFSLFDMQINENLFSNFNFTFQYCSILSSFMFSFVPILILLFFYRIEKKISRNQKFFFSYLTSLINLYTLTLSWQGRLLARAGDYSAAADIFNKILELWYAWVLPLLFIHKR